MLVLGVDVGARTDLDLQVGLGRIAAEQLEHAVKNLGARGASIGGHVDNEPPSSEKYDPFWAKAQELDVMIVMHPEDVAGAYHVCLKTGDGGETRLASGAPVSKTDPRVEAYGTVDELNATVGLARLHAAGDMAASLARIQNGEYARDFILENRAGAPTLNAKRRLLAEHDIEKVGEKLRAMMPWISAQALVDRKVA